jgi:hypothetical protein
MEKHMTITTEEKGLKNQIDRLETLRVSTCQKSHSFKKYTNEQLETIIEDLKDIHLGLQAFNNKPQPIKKSYPLTQTQEIIFFEAILDELCKLKKRDIFVVLPKKESERVPYLKKEILHTLGYEENPQDYTGIKRR